MSVVGLHHVQVAVPAGGEDVARAFYGDLLGMTEVAKPAALAARDGAWFRSGTAELHPTHPPPNDHVGYAIAYSTTRAVGAKDGAAYLTWSLVVRWGHDGPAVAIVNG